MRAKSRNPAGRSSPAAGGAAKPNDAVPNSFEPRAQYLVECFRAAHEEGMFRIRKRDSWLQLQLLAQVGLLSIARGLEISGVRPANPYPDALILSSAISAIFVTLYLIENSLVGDLSRYVAGLSTLEAKLSGGELIANWDASLSYRGSYIRGTLPFRFVAQLMTFFLVPLGITLFRLAGMGWGRQVIVEGLVHAILFSYVLVIVILNYRRRTQNAGNLTDQAGEGEP